MIYWKEDSRLKRMFSNKNFQSHFFRGDKNYGNVGKKSENEQAGECKEQ